MRYTLIFLFYPILCFCQVAPDLTVGQVRELQEKFTQYPSGMVTLEAVFDRPDADQDDLFSLVNFWIPPQSEIGQYVTFGDYPSHTYMLRMKRTIPSLIEILGPEDLYYSLTIRLKNERYKVLVGDIINVVNPGNKNGLELSLEMEDIISDQYLFKKNGSVKIIHAKVLYLIYVELSWALLELRNHMDGPLIIPSEEDDW